MNFDRLRRVSTLLRHGDELEASGGLLKQAGKIVDTVVNAAKSVDRGALSASEFLASKGHPVLAGTARLAPYGAAAYGAKKAYESEPVQRLRSKIDEIKMRRQLSQQGY